MKCICYNVEAPPIPANQANNAPVIDQPAPPGPIILAQAQDQDPSPGKNARSEGEDLSLFQGL